MTTATASTARAASLLTSEWETVRTALLCYAADQREAGNVYWAAQIRETYEIIRRQTR